MKHANGVHSHRGVRAAGLESFDEAGTKHNSHLIRHIPFTMQLTFMDERRKILYALPSCVEG